MRSLKEVIDIGNDQTIIVESKDNEPVSIVFNLKDQTVEMWLPWIELDALIEALERAKAIS